MFPDETYMDVQHALKESQHQLKLTLSYDCVIVTLNS